MSSYQCESCPYGASDLADLHKHWRQTGHASDSELAEAKAAQKKFIKGLLCGVAGGGLLIVGAAVSFRKAELGSLTLKMSNLESINGWQAAKIARLMSENSFLKSASGAGKVLRSFGA